VIIAIHNHKGGIGKTTLAAHLAYRCNVLGARCLVITLDRQGDLLRWFNRERVLDPKKLVKMGHITALYSPEAMPPRDVLDEFRLVIVDTPPQAGIPEAVDPDLWIAQVDNSTALDNLATILPKMAAKAPVHVVFWRADAGGDMMLRGLQAAAQHLKTVEFCPLILEQDAPIARTQAQYKPVWEVTRGKNTAAHRNMVAVCDAILERAGVFGDRRKAGRT